MDDATIKKGLNYKDTQKVIAFFMRQKLKLNDGFEKRNCFSCPTLNIISNILVYTEVKNRIIKNYVDALRYVTMETT